MEKYCGIKVDNQQNWCQICNKLPDTQVKSRGGAVPFVHLAVELEKLPVLGMKDFCKITTISILFCFNAKCNKCFLLGCLEEN